MIVSDSHGRYERLSELLDRQCGVDALIFLGDGLADLERADAYSRGFSVFAVKGNCDSFSLRLRESAPEESVINLDGYRFLLMHGHTRGVNTDLRTRYTPQESARLIYCFSDTRTNALKNISPRARSILLTSR